MRYGCAMRSFRPPMLVAAVLVLGGVALAFVVNRHQAPAPKPVSVAPVSPPQAAPAPKPAPPPPPAIDAAGAQGIVDGVHAMLASMLGALAPPTDLLQATAQGDHYHIEIPIAHRWKGGGIGGDSIGADLTPLGGGRWRIGNGAAPRRVEVSIDHPPQGMASMTVMTAKDLSFSGVIDTTLATPSSVALHAADENISGQGAQVGSGMHIDSADGTLRLTPTQDGRATLVSTSTLKGLRTTSVVGKLATGSEAQRAVTSLRIVNLSLAELRAGLLAISTLATLPQPPAAATPPDPAIRKQLHDLIAALATGATSIALRESEDGLVIHGPGPMQGAIGHLGFAMTFGEQDGTLSLALDIGLDKPSFPAIPSGTLAAFVPSHLVLQPRLAGIDASTLRQTLDAAVDNPGGSAFPSLVMTVLNAHPATIAIDRLAIDTGPAHITGHGTLTSSGPGNAQGTATVRATGLDAAIKELSADPQARQMLAGLLFLKGLGKADGDAMVWDLAFDGHKLLVNGNDISALAPGVPAPH